MWLFIWRDPSLSCAIPCHPCERAKSDLQTRENSRFASGAKVACLGIFGRVFGYFLRIGGFLRGFSEMAWGVLYSFGVMSNEPTTGVERMKAYSVEARNIRSGTYNGSKVKFFDLWEQTGAAWVFAGHHTAPVRTANKRLVAYAIEETC